MFQTDLNLWLQTFSWPPVHWLLSGVTLLGNLPFYVALLVLLAFASRLRQSLALAGAVLLAGLLTNAAKDTVAFPRPDEVDSRIHPSASVTPVAERGGASAFWALPAPAAIAAVRTRASGNYGFPSGHVGVATAFLLGGAVFFRSRAALALALAWVPLMAVSRLYLGRHFLADVAGGLVLGLAAAGLAAVLFRPLDGQAATGPGRPTLRPLGLLGAALLVATPFVPVLDALYVGAFAGLVVSCLVVAAGEPVADGGPPRVRARRVALATLLLAGSGLVAWPLLSAPPGRARLLPLAGSFLVVALTLGGTVRLARRLGLYERLEPPSR